MSEHLKRLLAAKAEYDSAIAASGRSALIELATDLFDAVPALRAIYWTQFTPSYNDGDPCYFSIGEVQFRALPHADDESEDWYDGEAHERIALGECCTAFECFENTTNAGISFSSYSSAKRVTDDGKAALQAFEKLLNELQDVAEHVYGDGAEVCFYWHNDQLQEFTNLYEAEY